MKQHVVMIALASSILAATGDGRAQQQAAPNPLDVVPNAMPFDVPYGAPISLDRAQMQVEDKLATLTPGMAVTAEIKTGSRTVLSYLLSPLMRYRQESLRER